MTVEQYDALVKAQDGRCAVCKKKRKLMVDHDHKTLEIRGLLCDLCNKGVGHFEDDPERLRLAATYLEKKR